jgi:hypothetical protein
MITERHPQSEIGLLEALQACAALGVRDGAHAQWLAECLGLTWTKSIAEPELQPTSSASLPATAEGPLADAPVNPEVKKLRLLDPVGQEPMAFEQVFEGQTEKIRNAVEIKPASIAESAKRPDFQPLFLDRWFQGIFSAVLGVGVPSPEIDFRKLERYVIEGEFFTQLPFKTRIKLIKGVHVLLDRSESMQPFWRDQTELISRLRGMLGAAMVWHSWFEYDPNASRITWHTSMPRQLRMETPLLLITDFGGGSDPIGAQTMNWEPWQPILELARCSRSRVFALIPSLPRFWPGAIGSFADCSLLWDRDTSPQTAARLCRR